MSGESAAPAWWADTAEWLLADRTAHADDFGTVLAETDGTIDSLSDARVRATYARAERKPSNEAVFERLLDDPELLREAREARNVEPLSRPGEDEGTVGPPPELRGAGDPSREEKERALQHHLGAFPGDQGWLVLDAARQRLWEEDLSDRVAERVGTDVDPDELWDGEYDKAVGEAVDSVYCSSPDEIVEQLSTRVEAEEPVVETMVRLSMEADRLTLPTETPEGHSPWSFEPDDADVEAVAAVAIAELDREYDEERFEVRDDGHVSVVRYDEIEAAERREAAATDPSRWTATEPEHEPTEASPNRDPDDERPVEPDFGTELGPTRQQEAGGPSPDDEGVTASATDSRLGAVWERGRREIAGWVHQATGREGRPSVERVEDFVTGLTALSGFDDEDETRVALMKGLDVKTASAEHAIEVLERNPMAPFERSTVDPNEFEGNVDLDETDAGNVMEYLFETELEEQGVDDPGEQGWHRWRLFQNLVHGDANEVTEAEREALMDGLDRAAYEEAVGEQSPRFRQFTSLDDLVGMVAPEVSVSAENLYGGLAEEIERPEAVVSAVAHATLAGETLDVPEDVTEDNPYAPLVEDLLKEELDRGLVDGIEARANGGDRDPGDDNEADLGQF